MRSILVSWVVLIHYKRRLEPETLHLAVNIMDRYLAKEEITKKKLYLLGAACLLIASKFIDAHNPCDVSLMAYLCDGVFTANDIVEMELHLLVRLDYQISAPNSRSFLSIYLLTASQADECITSISHFIVDATLVSYNLLEYLPSEIACAALLLARKIKGIVPWTDDLARITSYIEEDILPVARCVLSTLDSITEELKIVRHKYGQLTSDAGSSLEDLYLEL
jgi:cyclin B